MIMGNICCESWKHLRIWTLVTSPPPPQQVLPTLEGVRALAGTTPWLLCSRGSGSGGVGRANLPRLPARCGPRAAAYLRPGAHPPSAHRCVWCEVRQELPGRGLGLCEIWRWVWDETFLYIQLIKYTSNLIFSHLITNFLYVSYQSFFLFVSVTSHLIFSLLVSILVT